MKMENFQNFLNHDSVGYDLDWKFISIFGVAFGSTLLGIMIICVCIDNFNQCKMSTSKCL